MNWVGGTGREWDRRFMRASDEIDGRTQKAEELK